mmetsp:Transcript_76863/g.200161  ORF Transcript_76863/g.200161 Transcript_76863/m.200161 type:complete len:231 (+) Transcript_76863:1581-2273(+)
MRVVAQTTGTGSVRLTTRKRREKAAMAAAKAQAHGRTSATAEKPSSMRRSIGRRASSVSEDAMPNASTATMAVSMPLSGPPAAPARLWAQRVVARRPSEVWHSRKPSPEIACDKATAQADSWASTSGVPPSSPPSPTIPPKQLAEGNKRLDPPPKGVVIVPPESTVSLHAASMRSTHPIASFSVLPERQIVRWPALYTTNEKGLLWSLTHSTLAPQRFTTSLGLASCCDL